MTLTRETLEELRRLREAATPGEWEIGEDRRGFATMRSISAGYGDGYPVADFISPADAALIALAINNLSALLAAAERGLGAGDGR